MFIWDMRTKTKILKTKAEVKQLIKACKKMGYCCYDWETNGKPLYNHDFAPTILSITFQPGFACNIVMDHFQREEYGIEYSTKWAIKTIGHQLIEDYKVVKMAWNHKFDGQIFQKYHIYYRGTVIDGMLAKYVLNEEKPNGLKDMTRRYLPEYGNYESDRGFDKIPWDQKPLDQLCQYGGQDTDYTFRLCIFFEKKLIDLGLYDLFRNLIMPASRVLQSVEANGLYIDREFNEKLLEEYKQKIDKALDNILNLPKVKRFQRYWKQQRVDKYLESIQEEIEKFNEELEDATDDKVINSLNKKIASREQKITNIRAGVFTTKKEQELMAQINLGSNKDLPALIYSEEGLGFTCTEFTDTGNPSTSEDTLQQLRLTVKKPDSPKAIFLDNLLDLRGLQKMYTTFIDGWHEKTQDDNKLHGSFKIHGTTSGRLSSSEPNLQQIPKTSVDPNIKKQLIAKPGTLYISSDFSQAELRIMAHLSGDETYLKAFAEGNDPHLAIACKKYHVPYEDILPKYKDEEDPDHKVWSVRRKQAKQLAFGLIYGIGPGLLSVKLSDPKAGIIVTKEESKRQMDEYFDEHPALQKFKAKQEKVLKKNGFLKSLFGRKRRLPQVYSSNNDEVAYANRLGLNFPCLLPTSQALCKTKGWVNASDLTVGDEILAFNPRTGKSEWEPVLEVHEPDYDGDMYRFSSKHCGILSTSYHRWYVSKSEEFEKDISHRQYQDKIIEDFFTLQKTIHDKYESGKNLHQISIELGLPYTRVRRIYYGKVKSPLTSGITEPFKVMTSEEIYNSKGNCRIPIRAKHYNTNENTYTDNFIALCGWYLTDASIRRNKVVRITHSDSANHNKVVHIRELLKNSGLKYKEHIRISKVSTVVTWDISKDDSIKFMEVLPNRKLNMDFISSLTQSQLEILLYNMRLGDGYSILCSCDKEQASLIQAIVVLIGKTSSMFRLSYKGKRSYFKNHKPSKLGQEYIEATKDSWGIKFSDRLSIHTKSYGNKKVDKVPYQGKVWCPSVPSGAFFVRYIGDDGRYRTMITGNCQSAASDMCLFGSILIYYLMRQGKLPKMDSVTLVHDANYFNTTPEKINVWSLYEMWKIFSNPSTKKYFGFQIDDVLMDMDYHVGRTMAEELPFIPGYDYRKMLEPDFDVKEYMEEAKKFANIPISDYPKHFAKEMKKYEEDFKAGKY